MLGLSNYLGHEQLAKQGLRMWFASDAEEPFEECVEVGARYNSRLSGFQVDRAKLDEHLLELAVEAGCEIWRPAKVANLELGGVGQKRFADAKEARRLVPSRRAGSSMRAAARR